MRLPRLGEGLLLLPSTPPPYLDPPDTPSAPIRVYSLVLTPNAIGADLEPVLAQRTDCQVIRFHLIQGINLY